MIPILPNFFRTSSKLEFLLKFSYKYAVSSMDSSSCFFEFFLLNPRTRAARVLDAKQVYASQQNLWSSCPLQLYSPMLLEAQVLGQIALLKTKYGTFIVYLTGLISSLLFTQGKPQEVRLSNLTAAKGKLDQPTTKS